MNKTFILSYKHNGGFFDFDGRTTFELTLLRVYFWGLFKKQYKQLSNFNSYEIKKIDKIILNKQPI